MYFAGTGLRAIGTARAHCHGNAPAPPFQVSSHREGDRTKAENSPPRPCLTVSFQKANQARRGGSPRWGQAQAGVGQRREAVEGGGRPRGPVGHGPQPGAAAAGTPRVSGELLPGVRKPGFAFGG